VLVDLQSAARTPGRAAHAAGQIDRLLDLL
jgi:hypothetical protein